MPLSRTSSSTSTEVAGFRAEREIGRGSRAVVFDATQLSLHRHVALKLLDEPPLDGELRWPEHPHVVSLYAAGPCEDGFFVAMQLVRGRSLAETRRLTRRTVLRLLGEVADALDAAHRAGIAHGDVNARNVLVGEGERAYLSDFGLGSGLATPAADLADFAELVGERLDIAAPDGASAEAILETARRQVAPERAARWPLVAGGVAALAGVAIGAFVLLASGGSAEDVPAVMPGAVTLGSALPSSGAHSVDCAGQAPTGASQPCVVAQTRLAGRPLRARSGGVIRRWAVRDASGDLALEVLRRQGSSSYVVARTRFVHIPDRGVHVLRANMPVRPGDLVGLNVAPGSAVGVRSAARATTARRFGALDVDAASFDSRTAGQELLVRTEYLPGAKWRPSGLVTGPAAARARRGRVLDSLELQPRTTVAAVKVGERVAADRLVDRRRIARLFVAGARPAGRLGSLYTLKVRAGQPILRLQWRNPNGTLSRDFGADRRGLYPID
jgi:Protein kinase domain